MNINNLLSASEELAESIGVCLDGVRNTNPDLDPLYGVCLSAADDFAYLALYANTTSHFQQSNGGMLDKWYFAQWWSEGMDINTDPLMENLGEVGDIDETPENDNGPIWLAAMTNAMDIASKQRAFGASNDKSFLFCSLIDSANAVWLETESARFLNPQDSYATIASELAAAQHDWYGEDMGRPEYKAAFHDVLQQVKGAK